MAVVYKHIAKVLANRFRMVLGKIISFAQILDAVLIANECLDSRLKAWNPQVLRKLDLEKAYNHVNWGFLLYLLQRGGFSKKGGKHTIMSIGDVNLIYFLHLRSSLSIPVNGSPCGFFRSSRGICHGGPLSLLLCLVMESLSKMMEKAVGEGLLAGFSVDREGRNNLTISHLLLQPTLIFCEVDPRPIWHLQFLFTGF